MSIQTLADIPDRTITARDNQLLTWLAAVKIATARRRLQQLTAKYRLLVPLELEPEARKLLFNQ